MMVSLPATERLVGYVHRPGAVAERRRKLLESKVNSDFWERRGWPRKPPEIEGLANTGSWAVQHRGAGRSLRNTRTARRGAPPNPQPSNTSLPARARYSLRRARSGAISGDRIKCQPGAVATMPQRRNENSVVGARLLVVLLAFAWGLNWIAAATALREVTPWSLRFAGAGIGTAILFAAALVTGRNLKVPRGEYVHIMIAGFFNVAAFQVLSGFAQLSGATTRAIIITYSMPIWTTVLSRFVLGEQLTAMRWFAFGLCVAGVVILVAPLFDAGLPPFVFYSLGCALS